MNKILANEKLVSQISVVLGFMGFFFWWAGAAGTLMAWLTLKKNPSVYNGFVLAQNLNGAYCPAAALVALVVAYVEFLGACSTHEQTLHVN